MLGDGRRSSPTQRVQALERFLRAAQGVEHGSLGLTVHGGKRGGFADARAAVRQRQRDEHIFRALLRARRDAERLVQFDVERLCGYVRDGNHHPTLV